MNRELRRLASKDEERARKRRKEGNRPQRKQRVGVRQYLREVRQELKKVAWPSREQTVTFTVAVLVSTTALTAVIFGLDIFFKWALLRLVQAV
ncbi:MAG: preprotein translocase subunit SecE [Acidimicrobiia bacterium]|nr:preprotein translocase subunit SecE [Acidimicrobiia bacterium]